MNTILKQLSIKHKQWISYVKQYNKANAEDIVQDSYIKVISYCNKATVTDSYFKFVLRSVALDGLKKNDVLKHSKDIEDVNIVEQGGIIKIRSYFNEYEQTLQGLDYVIFDNLRHDKTINDICNLTNSSYKIIQKRRKEIINNYKEWLKEQEISKLAED